MKNRVLQKNETTKNVKIITPPVDTTGGARGGSESTFSIKGVLLPTRQFRYSKNSRTELTALPASQAGRADQSALVHCDFPQVKTRKKAAFTLAEVLITLGVIGIVAAMTMPTLMANSRKNVAEARLQKFYSTMNQAIQMSELTNGPKEYWEHLQYTDSTTYLFDENDTPVNEWYDKYLKPYVKTLKTDYANSGKIMLYFPDGSLALIGASSWTFWPEAKNFVDAVENESDPGNYINPVELSGTKYFTFRFKPYDKSIPYYYKHGMEPYTLSSWDGSVNSLITDTSVGCNEQASAERALCARLIQLNGWKIPKDYPLKF